MKTLIIVAHPSIEASTVNKKWVDELKKYPEKYTVHELYKIYPDKHIDILKEQRLIEAHENLVLQFPIHWFNCPPLLKQWLDDVLTYGWAYGSNGGDKLKNRKVALAVSAGIKKAEYSETGRYQHTLEQILLPFQTTFLYCNADYRSLYTFYGEEHQPGGTEEEDIVPANFEIENSASGYLRFLDAL